MILIKVLLTHIVLELNYNDFNYNILTFFKNKF